MTRLLVAGVAGFAAAVGLAALAAVFHIGVTPVRRSRPRRRLPLRTQPQNERLPAARPLLQRLYEAEFSLN